MSKEAEVVDKGIDVFSDMMTKLTEKLSTLVDQHGETVADVVLLYARMESLWAVVSVFIMIAAAYACYKISRVLLTPEVIDEASPLIMVVLLLGLVGVFLVIAIAMSLKGMVYGIAGVIYPEFWLSVQIIEKVL